jgi:hypothetical protein
MPGTIPTLTVLTALLALGQLATPAQAQLARTFVSSANGNDGNNCDRPTPCRTFQSAHDKTLANGEITVLDPGGYGGVTINKTISIINDGVGEAGTLVSGGFTGITINAGANDTVSLRGLTIKGIGFGSGNGIVFNSGKFLTIENCVIRNLSQAAVGTTGKAIVFQPSSASNLSQLAMSNTLIADSFIGINIVPAGTGIVKAALKRVELYNNDFGLLVAPTVNTVSARVSVADSVVDGSTGTGVQISLPAGATVLSSLMVTGSMISNNGNALVASGTNAHLRIGQTSVAGNGSTWQTVSGGLFQSYGDNYIAGNDVQPTPPVIARQ